MKAPLVVTFCNGPQLSCRVGLNLFNVIESATFHCFLQLREEEEVARSTVRGAIKGCVLPEIHLWWQPCGQGHCRGAGSNCRSATSQGDVCAQRRGGTAGLFCGIPCSSSVLYRRTHDEPARQCRRTQSTWSWLGLHLPCFLWSRRWCRAPLGGHLLCFQVVTVNPAFVTSVYRGHEVGIVLGSITEVSANWQAIVLLLHHQETGHNSAVTRLICKSSVRIFWYVPNVTLTSSANFLIVRRWSVRIFLAHMPHSPRCGRWTACLGGGRL